MSGVRQVTVAEEEGEVRLDRWFRRHFAGLSHGRLEKLLRTGQVRVDGARARASTRLLPGQTVRVPPLEEAPTRRPERLPSAAETAWLRALVLHRDAEMIGLNKPPGLAVQGGSKVAESLDAKLDALRFDAAERPRLVHRLDRDTSGVLLLARTPAAAARLTAAFRSHDTLKTYWALVAGVPKARQGRIDAPLAKRRIGGVERVVPGDEEGKRAVTLYRVMETAGRRVAWLALKPLTGRTHQLRVHCAALGTPILGDGKYGGAKAFIDGLPDGGGLHLHARSLSLPRPGGGRLEIVAPLPPGLAASWRFFGFDPEDSRRPFD